MQDPQAGPLAFITFPPAWPPTSSVSCALASGTLYRGSPSQAVILELQVCIWLQQCIPRELEEDLHNTNTTYVCGGGVTCEGLHGGSSIPCCGLLGQSLLIRHQGLHQAGSFLDLDFTQAVPVQE